MTWLRKLYYDTANAGSDLTPASTLQLVGPSHLVYGSDWPWAPVAAVAGTIHDLETASTLTDEERMAVYRGNALALLPRLGAQLKYGVKRAQVYAAN